MKTIQGMWKLDMYDHKIVKQLGLGLGGGNGNGKVPQSQEIQYNPGHVNILAAAESSQFSPCQSSNF